MKISGWTGPAWRMGIHALRNFRPEFPIDWTERQRRSDVRRNKHRGPLQLLKMLLLLSYPLSRETPFYSQLAKPELRQLYDLRQGDVCNSFYLTTSNHCGT